MFIKKPKHELPPAGKSASRSKIEINVIDQEIKEITLTNQGSGWTDPMNLKTSGK